MHALLFTTGGRDRHCRCLMIELYKAAVVALTCLPRQLTQREEYLMKMPLMLVAGAILVIGMTDVQADELAAGEERYKVNCVNCHGKTGKGMAAFPAIAGRDQAYVVERLTKYRAKEKVGPNSAIMMSLA